jgi:hypothetical protein
VDDREFEKALTACTLPSDRFDHVAHVRLAWIYLREQPLLTALQRFVTTLQRYATSLGAAGKYHETVTFAFILVIADRMHRTAAPSFDEFLRANQDLSRWTPSVLDDYYDAATLASETARTRFLLPDRA